MSAEIHFAQVREDAEVERRALAMSGGSARRVVVVASGGCTALSLLDDGVEEVLAVWEARMVLVDNLYAEHGRMVDGDVHAVTYREFLTAIGVSSIEIEVSMPTVPVLAYTRALLDLCARAPLGEAFAALGVVEEIVARASPIVARYATRHSGGPLGSHYSVHETLDLTHAEELYELAANTMTEGTRGDVVRGVAMGRYLQERLYEGLLAERRSGRR